MHTSPAQAWGSPSYISSCQHLGSVIPLPLKCNTLGINLIFSPPPPLVPLFSSPLGLKHQNHLGTLLLCPHIPHLPTHPTHPLIYTLTEQAPWVPGCAGLWDIHHGCPSSLGGTSRTAPDPEIVRKPVSSQAVPRLQGIHSVTLGKSLASLSSAL